jgi:tetraacyldisaccharide 4'-kinase
MKHFDGLAERVRKGEPLPPVVDALLSALTPLTRLGMRRRLRGPRERVKARVISFGNITAGGTGKTPAVIERAQVEVAAGRRVAVLTRGYGGSTRAGIAVVEAGENDAAVAERLGDEPALIRRRVPEVVLVRARNRVAGARLAVERFGCDTLILDDGFQYVRLARDEDIVLIDATNPFGNGHLLPRGILREPLEALGRADGIVVTRCDQAGDLSGLRSELARRAPEARVRWTRHAPSHLQSLADGAQLPLEWLRGREVDAACAIGNPEAFLRTLEGLGARVIRRHAFADHRAFDPGALQEGRPLIVTEKDAVRVADPREEVLALAIELRDVEVG